MSSVIPKEGVNLDEDMDFNDDSGDDDAVTKKKRKKSKRISSSQLRSVSNKESRRSTVGMVNKGEVHRKRKSATSQGDIRKKSGRSIKT